MDKKELLFYVLPVSRSWYKQRMKTLLYAMAFTRYCQKRKITHVQRTSILEEAGSLLALDRSFVQDELPTLSRRRWPKHWRAVTAIDDAYPWRLKHISHPPAVLFMSGENVDLLNAAFVIAVIGSRKPSPYGIEVTQKLAKEIALKNIPIISGGARGIDALAHRAALAQGSRTAAVLGTGLDVVYPPEHRALYQAIESKGLLISEYLPGTGPRRHHFPARNRIMAGLCDAVLVTEASASSGTLITAGFAADYGRDVAAVPGSILEHHSQSCHDLIRDGALLVESIDDILGITPQSKMMKF